MTEQNSMPRKKVILRALLLGACLLVIAGVTVISVLAANNWGKGMPQLDEGNDHIADGNNNGDNNDDVTPDDGNDEDDKDDTAGTDDNKPVDAEEGFVLPVENIDIVTGYVFGKDATLGHYHFHSGLDFAAEAGTQVVACLDGTVESIVTGDRLNGTTVTIAHADGIKTVYSYIDAAEGLEVGHTVTRGQAIGTVAQANGAEFALGPHLHFAVYEGETTANPEDFLPITQK